MLRRRDRRRRRRPDRLPARRRRRASWSPTPPTPPRCVRRLRGGRARRASRSTDQHHDVRRARRAGPAQSDEVLAGARAADRPRLHVVRRGRLARAGRSSSAAPATPASAATSWSALGRRRRPLWDALLAAGEPLRHAALRPRRPRHAAHRDGLPAARPGPQPRHHAGPGPRSAGRSAGRRTRSGAGTRWSPRRRPGPPRLLRGLVATGRGIPRPDMQVRLAHGDVPVGEVTSGTFSPTLKQGIGLALLDRRCAEGDEVVVDVRGARGRRDGGQAAVRAGPDPPGLTRRRGRRRGQAGRAARHRLRRRAAGRPRRPSGPPRGRPRPPPRGRRR